MRHFQTRVYRKTDFKLRIYRCFRRASTTRGRHSHEAHQAPQTPFHKARFRKTANCILEERCENSPRKRVYENRLLIGAPLLKYRPLSHEALRFTRATPWWENPEPKWTPNPTSMCATLIKSRILNGPEQSRRNDVAMAHEPIQAEDVNRPPLVRRPQIDRGTSRKPGK
jgi:hypothetical protein